MKSKTKTEEYSSEGSLEDAYVDGRINEEPPMYDDLLKALFPNNPSVSHVHKKRQREHEGLNSMDYEDSTSGISDGEEFNGGGVSDFSPNKFNLRKRKHPHVVEDKDLETINPHEVSDSDQEEDAERDIGEFTDELSRGRSFHDHFGIHKKLEIDVLMKKIQKFKWEMSAVYSSTSKWLGTGECFLKDIGDDVQYELPGRLYNHWLKEYEASGGNDFHVSRQREFFLLFNSYRDIMHCNKKPFYLTGIQEDSSITDAYIIHAMNHVFRTRNLVIKNDARLAKDQDNAKEKLLCGSDFRDQGFTRPKVLFLLPYRSLALRLVKRLIRLTPLSKKGNVEHLRRFFDEFGTDDDAKATVPNSALEAAGAKHRTLKPKDHEVLFGGNNDDCFMMGIKFNKWSIKLYADFYSCDMIVASPLGVSKKIAETTKEKGKDVDYLSSIEVLVIDHADVIAMQNWSHLTTVVEQLNHLPSKQHRTDFMRVRQWYLDGQARFYRQTILLSSFLNPDMSSLFSHFCVNHEGKVKLTCSHKGILLKVSLSVKQVYERFDPNSIDDIDDARFHCFVKKVFPKIKDSIQGGIMIFVSSYLDFVRVRNFLKSQGASFCLLGEYTKQSDISRARVWFFQGTRKIMLYTERAHFYHRYKIRGIQNLFIYSLPERKDFYPEMLNMLDESKNMMCTVLFSRFDHLKLERVVGTAASKRMISSKQGMFVFC